MQKNNDLFLRALKGEQIERSPIWMMRQAGRYLPEYLETRKQAGTFMNLCRSADLCAQVALQPIDRFGFDAAILFSDILTIPDAMGMGLDFIEGKGPCFAKNISSISDIESLKSIEISTDLLYVLNALRVTKEMLNSRVPIIGFSGSPWTLAVYMLQGSSSVNGEFPRVHQALQKNREVVRKLLDLNTKVIIEYLLAQISEGAQALQVFDTWGGLLTGDDYMRYSLEPLAEIVASVKQFTHTPIILFSKGQHVQELMQTGADCLSIDQYTDMSQVVQQVDKRVVLQGNLNPDVLTKQDVLSLHNAIDLVLDQAKGSKGHIFNLGHGVTPDALPDMVAEMVSYVQSK